MSTKISSATDDHVKAWLFKYLRWRISILASASKRIAALAALRGIELPPVTTREEGRAVLKQLIVPR